MSFYKALGVPLGHGVVVQTLQQHVIIEQLQQI